MLDIEANGFVGPQALFRKWPSAFSVIASMGTPLDQETRPARHPIQPNEVQYLGSG
jgi:hypothetical protein